MQSIEFAYIFLETLCVITHEAFKPVCLNKHVLWAALVGLHDRECAWLPPKSDVPNR